MKTDYHNKEQLSFKYILTADNNWTLFKSMFQKELSDDVIKEVEKMLNCCNPKNGFATYLCLNCGQTKKIPFSCKSKLCSPCGKKYTDIWSNELIKYLLNTPHFHITLTVSDKLWPYIQANPELQKLLLNTAAKNITRLFSEFNEQKVKITLGQIWVLHPFGDDLESKHHCHGIVTAGGLSKKNQCVTLPKDFIPYAAIRKKWQYDILTAIRKHMPPSIKLNAIIDWCFKTNNNGFYIHVRKIYGKSQYVLKYIARYVRHPAISNSRIINYNGTEVTFTYEREGKEHIKTMPKFKFIKAVIQHIVPKQFKVIRRIGLYSRRSKAKHEIASRILQSNPTTITRSFNWRRNITQYTGKDPLVCDHCNCKMELYQITYPTPNGFKTVGGLHWIIGGADYAQPPPPIQKNEKVKEQEWCQLHLSEL